MEGRRRQIWAAQTPVLLQTPVETLVKIPASPDPHACPKCGKVVKRGMYFHAKYCKGI